MPRIRKLDIQGFRGIRHNLPLVFDGKSILLFGENGAGKSSFVDALEKLLAGRISTLDGRGLGLSSERHSSHIRNGQFPMRLTLTFDDPASTVVDLQTNLTDLPVQIRQYLEAARENVYILRRRQVLEYVESQPRERYDLLRPFLPLSGVEAIEETLGKARDESEAEVRSSVQRVASIAQDIRRLLGGLTSRDLTEAEVVAALNQELASVGLEGIPALDQIQNACSRVSAALEPFGDLSRHSSVSGAIHALEELLEVLQQIQVEFLVTAVEALREKESREARTFYEAVLEQGVRWIDEEGRNTCPLCEQPVEPRRLAERAYERLVAMKEVLNLRQDARRRLDTSRQALRSAADTARRVRRQIEALPEAIKDEPSTVEAADDALGALAQLLQRNVEELDVEALRRSFARVGPSSSIAKDLARRRDTLKQLLASLPSPDAAKRLIAVRDRLERVSGIWLALGNARASSKEAARRASVAQAVYECVQRARKKEVQLLLQELSGEINSIYTRLHPDESHGGVQLEVREAVRESVNLRADFYDQRGEDPRAYYSDAHLDTLGLSIFLALRRWYYRQEPEFDLLILDDVLTSVDTAHAVRLSEILLTEFKEYQVLLTTHDRIWFEHMRDIQARCGVAQSFVNKIIHKWTIDEGPDIREPEEERRALDRLIRDGSAEGIAVAAGRLLEHVLQEMRYSLRLSVRAKRGEQYEIGELWPVFYAAVKRDYPTLYESVRKSVDSLDVRWPVRNWIGAHRNEWARNVSRSTAIEFAEAVADLFDHVFCSMCRRFITPSATPLGQLACHCGERIYPARGREARPGGREELVRVTQGALRDAQLDTARYFEWEKAETGQER